MPPAISSVSNVTPSYITGTIMVPSHHHGTLRRTLIPTSMAGVIPPNVYFDGTIPRNLTRGLSADNPQYGYYGWHTLSRKPSLPLGGGTTTYTGYSGYIPPPASQLRTGPGGELSNSGGGGGSGSRAGTPTTHHTHSHPHQPIGRTTPDIPTITITSSSLHQSIPTTTSTNPPSSSSSSSMTTSLNVASLALVNQTNALKIAKSDGCSGSTNTSSSISVSTNTTTNCEHATQQQPLSSSTVQVCPSGRTHCF